MAQPPDPVRLTGVDADRSLLTNLVLARGVVDRGAEHRADAPWQEARRSDPRSRVLRVCDGSALIRRTDNAAALELASVTEVPVDAELAFLGVDDDGVAFFAEHVGWAHELADGADWADLRQVGAQLSARDAGLMVTAVALDNWLRTHTRCPRCGAPTEFHAAGWSRRCPDDGSEHFPRTDPAVIVLVRDEHDRALLGRQHRWTPGWFSTLAGFVESGESAEAAVRREVHEESGVVIGDDPDSVVYLGSQPWPFPCSLMLGYHAWASATQITVDDDEIAEARWFSRDELARACETGEVRLPPTVSIARRLVERWYGSELPGDWSREIPVPPR
jgi:NAD+ diphosphatase